MKTCCDFTLGNVMFLAFAPKSHFHPSGKEATGEKHQNRGDCNPVTPEMIATADCKICRRRQLEIAPRRNTCDGSGDGFQRIGGGRDAGSGPGAGTRTQDPEAESGPGPPGADTRRDSYYCGLIFIGTGARFLGPGLGPGPRA